MYVEKMHTVQYLSNKKIQSGFVIWKVCSTKISPKIRICRKRFDTRSAMLHPFKIGSLDWNPPHLYRFRAISVIIAPITFDISQIIFFGYTEKDCRYPLSMIIGYKVALLIISN